MAKINGWKFPIRKKSGPGEYRYLRLTWKTAGADGMMLELASGGHWPQPNSGKFRYYAGRNSTPWKATEIAPSVPSEWTTVTRDVWKDCGDCTLTGIGPTVMNGAGLFGRIELLQSPDEP